MSNIMYRGAIVHYFDINFYPDGNGVAAIVVDVHGVGDYPVVSLLTYPPHGGVGHNSRSVSHKSQVKQPTDSRQQALPFWDYPFPQSG